MFNKKLITLKNCVLDHFLNLIFGVAQFKVVFLKMLPYNCLFTYFTILDADIVRLILMMKLNASSARSDSGVDWKLVYCVAREPAWLYPDYTINCDKLPLVTRFRIENAFDIFPSSHLFE